MYFKAETDLMESGKELEWLGRKRVSHHLWDEDCFNISLDLLQLVCFISELRLNVSIFLK